MTGAGHVGRRGLHLRLIAGADAGQAKIEELLKTAGAQPVNGWRSAAHLFDHNHYRLGLGRLDAPEWKIADPKSVVISTKCVLLQESTFGISRSRARSLLHAALTRVT